ncbi:MAG: chemotaxis protein CheD [Planctomycetota bacterium]|jgi:chemotaxis protein CheD
MGEIGVARGDARDGDPILRTLLGSCIGMALYDRERRVAGLAHIVLPQSRGQDEPPGKFVDTAVPALIHAMETLVGRRVKPEARIAGGANMFATSVTETVGKRNIEACEQLLAAYDIPLKGRHCGGRKGRRMLLDAGTGEVTIEVVGAAPVGL